MAKSEYYVDPLNGSDTTGDGLSDGTAWQTVQNALNSITKNTTDGDRINVKDTADDVLTAPLQFGAIGSYSLTYGLLIEGYSTNAGDGGVGPRQDHHHDSELHWIPQHAPAQHRCKRNH